MRNIIILVTILTVKLSFSQNDLNGSIDSLFLDTTKENICFVKLDGDCHCWYENALKIIKLSEDNTEYKFICLVKANSVKTFNLYKEMIDFSNIEIKYNSILEQKVDAIKNGCNVLLINSNKNIVYINDIIPFEIEIKN